MSSTAASTGSRAVGYPDADLRVDARRNQQRILRAAARLLGDDPTVSMQRIADEAEVARPTVYRRYATREALVTAIRSEAVSEFRAAIAAAAVDGRDTATSLVALIRALGTIGANYPVLMSDPVDLSDGQLGLDEIASAREFDALIVLGQADGTLRDDVSSEVIRRSILGALTTSLRLARLNGSSQSPVDIAAEVASILIDGARRR